jgi:hypothetical protein
MSKSSTQASSAHALAWQVRHYVRRLATYRRFGWRQLRSASAPRSLIATNSGRVGPQPLSASTQTATSLPKQLGLLVSSATEDFISYQYSNGPGRSALYQSRACSKSSQ